MNAVCPVRLNFANNKDGEDLRGYQLDSKDEMGLEGLRYGAERVSEDTWHQESCAANAEVRSDGLKRFGQYYHLHVLLESLRENSTVLFQQSLADVAHRALVL